MMLQWTKNNELKLSSELPTTGALPGALGFNHEKKQVVAQMHWEYCRNFSPRANAHSVSIVNTLEATGIDRQK